ncbi:MAG TPA: outer membrane beta-barrel protein [Archangium sp.]|uniref:outer membrane protein n=1 Tax=Archangium sp. TaxID=1872627 RepID=UPI002E2FCB49|nr:outer membrane beta-barrel protein [Archangium sp.]HEX5746250.1 outer membrane beta-barrel protein [Archangium sp.]
MNALPLLTLLALAPTAAPAQTPAPQETAPAAASPEPGGRILLAPKLGFFKTTTPLNGAFFLGAEAGYLTPLLDNRLAIVAEFNFHQPDVRGTLSDPQLPGDAPYTLTEREMAILLSAVYRFEGTLTPYVGAGPGLYLHRAQAEAFGSTYTETEGTLGFQLLGGLEYKLGPGGAFAEVHYHFTRVGFLTTGDVNIGGFLAAGVGYRLHL